MHRHNEFELREQIRCTGAIDVNAGLEGLLGFATEMSTRAETFIKSGDRHPVFVENELGQPAK